MFIDECQSYDYVEELLIFLPYGCFYSRWIGDCLFECLFRKLVIVTKYIFFHKLLTLYNNILTAYQLFKNLSNRNENQIIF